MAKYGGEHVAVRAIRGATQLDVDEREHLLEQTVGAAETAVHSLTTLA